MTLGNLLLAAERLGFKAAEVKPEVAALTQMPPPFLVLGRRPGEGWLAEARIGDHLVLQDLEARRAAAHHVETVADLADGSSCSSRCQDRSVSANGGTPSCAG